jgi:hypothetical protein
MVGNMAALAADSQIIVAETDGAIRRARNAIETNQRPIHN